MKKIVIFLSVCLLLVSGPITSFALTQKPVEIENPNNSMLDSYRTDTATFDFEGVTYTLTLNVEGDYQEAIISDGKTEETVSYDSKNDELRFNNELVSDEDLEIMKDSVADSSLEDGTVSLDSEFQVMAKQKIPYKLVKTNHNAINVPVATVLIVTGLILLIPTGTGAVAGAVMTAKVIAIIAASVTSALKDTGNKYVYFTFKTYYKGQGGYWWNKFVLSAYKDDKRKKLIKTVTHETKYGKKYSYDVLEKQKIPNTAIYA